MMRELIKVRFALSLAATAVLIIASAATFIPGVARAAGGETVTAPFSRGPNGATTASSYTGTVSIGVSGSGQASASAYSDAFYVFTNNAGDAIAPERHADFGLCINSQPVDQYVTTIPPYSSTHVYHFTMTANGSQRLTFGVCDTYTADNTGSFVLTIASAQTALHIVFAPTTAQPGMTVQATGSGFYANGAVVQTAFGGTNPAPVDGTGAFVTNFKVPSGTAPGQYPISYRETTSAGQSATDVEQYTVTTDTRLTYTNGCTGVPDSVPGIFDFKVACDHHDVCYAYYPSTGHHEYADSEAGRQICDANFLFEMKQLCAVQHPGNCVVARVGLRSCLVVADTYFLGVRAVGWWWYIDTDNSRF